MFFKDDCDISKIPSNLKQVFENKFTISIGQKEIIKMKNNGVITDRDLNISRFLFKFKFATLEQVYKYLYIDANLKSEEGVDIASKQIIKNRLEKLVKYRVLNKFALVGEDTVEKIPQEALEVYCLDLGGRYLLAHYSNEDTSDWYSTVNMKSSEIVCKDLFITDFYLSILSTCPNKLLYFNVEPDIRVAKKNVIPSFDFCLDVGGNKAYYVGEVLREIGFPIQFRERVYKLEELLESNAWKKYYYDSPSPPVLFIFADSDEIALESSRLISETTEMNRFRVSTDLRVRKPLFELGAFLRYNKEKDELEEIKAITFAP